MIATALGAFAGAFAAILVMNEVQVESKGVKYTLAFFAGLVLAAICGFVLSLLLGLLPSSG